jgi:hypothetical protein
MGRAHANLIEQAIKAGSSDGAEAAKDVTIHTLAKEVGELADELDLRNRGHSQRALAARELLKRMGLAWMIVPVEKFGRDHWSTFAYLACTIVGNDGIPDRTKMRCDSARHPFLAHFLPGVGGSPPTRLMNGETLRDHDDWDCADDLCAAGLLLDLGTGANPLFDLTPEGWEALKVLLVHRRQSACKGQGAFGTFVWERSARGA